MDYNLLNKLVENSKLNKLQIAKAANISRTTLDNTLAGADIKLSTLESLSRVLGVSPSVFYDDPAGNVATASGRNSVAAAGHDISVGRPADGEAVLQERVKYLEQLLDEKERLIKVYEKMMEK